MSNDFGVPVVDSSEVSDQIIGTTEVSGSELPQSLNMDDFKVGYVVGVDSHDKVLFKPFGYANELHGLLGVHTIADKFVNALVNDKFVSGDRLVHEVGKGLVELAKKVDSLAASPELNKQVGKLQESLDAIEKELRKLFFKLSSPK